jgi:hypothetical protein
VTTEALAPIEPQLVAVRPEDMADEALARLVQSTFIKFRDFLPYVKELRYRFCNRPRGHADIMGCATWTEFCNNVLGRTTEAVRKALAPDKKPKFEAEIENPNAFLIVRTYSRNRWDGTITGEEYVPCRASWLDPRTDTYNLWPFVEDYPGQFQVLYAPGKGALAVITAEDIARSDAWVQQHQDYLNAQAALEAANHEEDQRSRAEYEAKRAARRQREEEEMEARRAAHYEEEDKRNALISAVEKIMVEFDAMPNHPDLRAVVGNPAHLDVRVDNVSVEQLEWIVAALRVVE